MESDARKGADGFRSILKGTSVFGGVQVFNILISAIRVKCVAVILGPAGMGVAGLFYSASLTIQQLASLGLNLSIVKEIGRDGADSERLASLLGAIRPLVVFTALLGALACLLFPSLLSSVTFGSEEYAGAFRLLSAAVFFSIVGNALMSVLQGLHAVGPLSKASVIGSVIGLVAGVPLYWLFGTRGIVPALVVLALSSCLWYCVSLRKVLTVRPDPFNRELHLPVIKRILAMGIILMSNDLFRNAANYLMLVFVRRLGGEVEVGLFQSCLTMTSQYSAIVFTAMAMDYLPRLARVSGDDAAMCVVVNRQMEVVGLLIAPIACAVILCAPLVIELLQTGSFLPAVPLLRLMAASVVLRALMYPLGYIVFAKDNRRLFFWMESVGANLLTLTLTCGGYLLFGLQGLGYAAIADCAVCLIVYVGVNRRLYGYRISRQVGCIMISAIIAAVAMMTLSFTFSGITLWLTGGTLLAGIGIFSGRQLLERIRRD